MEELRLCGQTPSICPRRAWTPAREAPWLTGAAVDDVGEFEVSETEVLGRPDDVLELGVQRPNRHIPILRKGLKRQQNYQWIRAWSVDLP